MIKIEKAKSEDCLVLTEITFDGKAVEFNKKKWLYQ
jgi:hypothetical protein